MDIETTAVLSALERRIYYLEQKMEHMADVGDMVEIEQHLHGNVYSIKNVEIKRIIKKKPTLIPEREER